MKRRSYASDEGWLLSYADLITNLLVFFAMLLAAADISRTKLQQITQGISGVEQPASLSSIQGEIDARIEAEGLRDLVRTDLTDDGLKLSLNSGLVFDSGSAMVRPDQVPTLDRMLQTLTPYSGTYAFAVEGHTDQTPVAPGGAYPSNWELSAARANAVRGLLQAVGVSEQRIRVEGYADTVPLPEAELAPLDEADRLARHRRVVVRIY
jgi:chemotaxis protein MotB